MARYLLLGHLTRDLYPGYFLYGGAVLYAGLLARRLGFETRVITASAEKEIEEVFPELRFYHFNAKETTTFENIETPLGRRQKVYARSPVIPLGKVPEKLRKAEIIHVAPVLDEVKPEELSLFDTNFLVANPQGWFRRLDAQGNVIPIRPDIDVWPQFKALVVSEEDVQADPHVLSTLRAKAEFLVVTKGKRGATLFAPDEEIFCQAVPAPRVIDTTGAGDIFAAAFFAMLYATGKPLIALKFAQCLASYSVGRRGLASVPTLEEIAKCLENP
ncbi:PfkB family carbohydrate kinase [Thermodesulfatator atlanticus]|uniref:PfkB family carbohydrate kinase n=1 Tax=Thermodesulfatator atlanticus TaxID=501497 RepID=UPI0003B7534D|nr:PfkB family carbohydrate kinase [Thermodesulfatator atlanticus]